MQTQIRPNIDLIIGTKFNERYLLNQEKLLKRILGPGLWAVAISKVLMAKISYDHWQSKCVISEKEEGGNGFYALVSKFPEIPFFVQYT